VVRLLAFFQRTDVKQLLVGAPTDIPLTAEFQARDYPQVPVVRFLPSDRPMYLAVGSDTGSQAA